MRMWQRYALYAIICHLELVILVVSIFQGKDESFCSSNSYQVGPVRIQITHKIFLKDLKSNTFSGESKYLCIDPVDFAKEPRLFFIWNFKIFSVEVKSAGISSKSIATGGWLKFPESHVLFLGFLTLPGNVDVWFFLQNMSVLTHHQKHRNCS